MEPVGIIIIGLLGTLILGLPMLGGVMAIVDYFKTGAMLRRAVQKYGKENLV